MDSAVKTTDHNEIKAWALEQGGKPAKVKGSGDDNEGIIRIDFGKSEENLKPITWEEFFKIFEDNKLALLYKRDEDDRFNKLVEREK